MVACLTESRAWAREAGLDCSGRTALMEASSVLGGCLSWTLRVSSAAGRGMAANHARASTTAPRLVARNPAFRRHGPAKAGRANRWLIESLDGSLAAIWDLETDDLRCTIYERRAAQIAGRA